MLKPLTVVVCLAVACQASKPGSALPVQSPETAERPATTPVASERAGGDAPAPEPVREVVQRRSQRDFGFTEVDDALRAAEADPKPILLYFRAQWSMDSIEFEQSILPTTGVRDRLQTSFHSVYVDVTNDEDPAVSALIQRFQVKGIPAVLFLDGKGIESDRIYGHIDRKTFLSKIDLVP